MHNEGRLDITLPKDMAILRIGEQPTLESIEVTREALPKVGAGEVLVRIHASSLNFHDYLIVAGHIRQPASRVPMSDGAGEVVALGLASMAGILVIG